MRAGQQAPPERLSHTEAEALRYSVGDNALLTPPFSSQLEGVQFSFQVHFLLFLDVLPRLLVNRFLVSLFP